MNNYILVSRTYAETTPESAEDSDFSDNGFISQDEQYTFSELVQLMRDHPVPSMFGNPEPRIDTHVWFSTHWYTKCYRIGTEREESIHFSENNTTNAAKYWALARQYAKSKYKI